MEGNLDKAEKLLLKGEPTPAVADELRKIASKRASLAKKNGDWEAVIYHLENYNQYARTCEEHCIEIANQAPPPHTARDQKLLEKAKRKLHQAAL